MPSGSQHKISPKKFSEKIALLNKREAERNSEFEAIIKEVQATRNHGASSVSRVKLEAVDLPFPPPPSNETCNAELTDADQHLEDAYRSLIQCVQEAEAEDSCGQKQQSYSYKNDNVNSYKGSLDALGLARYSNDDDRYAGTFLRDRQQQQQSASARAASAEIHRCCRLQQQPAPRVNIYNPPPLSHQARQQSQHDLSYSGGHDLAGASAQSMKVPIASFTTKSQPDMPYAQEQAVEQVIAPYRARGTSFGSSTANNISNNMINNNKYYICGSPGSTGSGQIVQQDQSAEWNRQVDGAHQFTGASGRYLDPGDSKQIYWQKSSSDPSLNAPNVPPTASQINSSNDNTTNLFMSNSEDNFLISTPAVNRHQESFCPDAQQQQDEMGFIYNQPTLLARTTPECEQYEDESIGNINLLPGIKICSMEEEIQQLKQDLKSQVNSSDPPQQQQQQQQQQHHLSDTSLPDLASSWTPPSQCMNQFGQQASATDDKRGANWPTAMMMNNLRLADGHHFLSASGSGLSSASAGEQHCSLLSDNYLLCDNNSNSSIMMRSHSHNCIAHLSKQQQQRRPDSLLSAGANCSASYNPAATNHYNNHQHSTSRPNHWPVQASNGFSLFADSQLGVQFAGESGNRFAGGSGTSTRALFGSMSPISSLQSELNSPASSVNTEYTAETPGMSSAAYLSYNEHELMVSSQPQQQQHYSRPQTIGDDLYETQTINKI